jgi:phenylacetate-coenzyme A ligase PaaK-like adenylate-forming protein
MSVVSDIKAGNQSTELAGELANYRSQGLAETLSFAKQESPFYRELLKDRDITHDSAPDQCR